MKAGAASILINNDIGTLIQGAGIPNQRVEAIRDNLEANALYLADDETSLLFVSCDLAALETARVRRYTQAMAAAAGIPPECILIGCTHTHAGPVVLHTAYQKPVDEAYSRRLQEWLCTIAAQAVRSAVPAGVGWKIGNARLGYNRRVCYADGTHSMYRRADADADFTGVEGSDDTQCLALAALDAANRIIGILHHGTGHPASFYGRNVLTADYPGVARRLIREAYGPLPVLFFNGSLGDVAMWQQAHPQATPNSPDAEITRSGSALAGETLRLLHEMQPRDDLRLQHRRDELELPVRLPAAEAVAKGRAMLARIDAGENVRGMEAIFAWGPVSLAEQFADNPVDKLAFHALRIGDLAIATQPFELFCQYQLDLKRRSPARDTAVFGLIDGYGGYLPTLAAELGGGYSGVPFAWARFGPAVGCLFVDHAATALHALWQAPPGAKK